MRARFEGQPSPGAWQLFDRDAGAYEEWYASRRGRRADRAERGLLEHLLVPFATARTAVDIGCGTAHFTRWLGDRLRYVAGVDRAHAMLQEARRRSPRLDLIQGDAHHLPIQDRAVDLSVFVLALEFIEQPALALTEAVRIARRGVLIVALNRWSRGGVSRRWGADARRPLLGRARDFTPTSLRALASASAAGRLRQFHSAHALLAGRSVAVTTRIPFGDVVGVALELRT
jgi:ubiquinone/menaquinone biosynthesis C-methylase UbiE